MYKNRLLNRQLSCYCHDISCSWQYVNIEPFQTIVIIHNTIILLLLNNRSMAAKKKLYIFCVQSPHISTTNYNRQYHSIMCFSYGIIIKK